MGKRSRAKERAGQSATQRRAAAKSSGMSLRDYKSGAKAPSPSKSSGSSSSSSSSTKSSSGSSQSSGGSSSSGSGSSAHSFSNAQLAGNAGQAKGLVGARRDAARGAGMSLRDYKKGLASGTINKHGQPTRQFEGKQDNKPVNNTGFNANNADMLTTNQATPGRLSSEGLYQDRYNVGYHGEDDQGDEYASNAYLGSIKSYFKGYASWALKRRFKNS